MKNIIATIIISLFLSACGGGSGNSGFVPVVVADPIPPVSTPTRPIEFDRYVIVGDSIMAGWPASLVTASLMLMEEDKLTTNISRSGQTLHNAYEDGVSGAINYLTLNGLGKDNIAVVVELAHNDWFNSFGLNTFFEQYTAFIDEINDEGLQNVYVFCVSPIASRWDFDHRVNNLNESYADVRNAVRRVAATGKCELIETGDWYTESDVFDTSIFLDGLHLGPNGHRIYKDRLMEVLDTFEVPDTHIDIPAGETTTPL